MHRARFLCEPRPGEHDIALEVLTGREVTARFPAYRLPENMEVGAGFSFHGYKFCSVIGEILADLAIDGRTDHDIGLFRLSRF